MLAQAAIYRFGIWQNIGRLPGWDASYAGFATNGAGVVVGAAYDYAGTFDGYQHSLLRWTPGGGLVNLGDLPGGSIYAVPRDMSADGNVIVGVSAIGARNTELLGFIWTPQTGVVRMSDYLQGLGVNLAGWKLTSVTGVSANGLVFAGNAVNPLGQTEGWIAHVPGPGTALALAGAAAGLGRRRRVP